MRRIAIGSGKGGVGRTTLAANLGIALAGMGKSTVIVDGCLTSPSLALFFQLEKVAYTLNDVLNGDIVLSDVVYEGPRGVKIIPAALTLEEMRRVKPERLPKVLEDRIDEVDLMLVDAPNGLRQETISALEAGEELLVLATPELSAISDAMKTKVAGEFLGLKPIGVVLNQVEGEGYELSSEEIERIMDLPILGKIPYDEEIRGALKEGIPLLEWRSNSPAAKAIEELGERLAKES